MRDQPRILLTTWLLSLSFAIVAGCAPLSESVSVAGNSIKKATAPMRNSWRRATETKPDDPIVDWNWTVGIPVGAPRGELLAAKIPADAIAHFVPSVRQQDVQHVSTMQQLDGFEIRNISGQEVNNCEEIHAAIERLPASATNVQVDLAQVGPAHSAGEVAVKVDQSTLTALSHAIAQETAAFRVSEAGNPTLVIRDGGIRCQVVVRVERNLGLVQLVLTTMNCWGQGVMLPVEITATCNGGALRCLTVADALELLYGDRAEKANTGSASFAETSEREDYLLPVNYKRLSENTAQHRGLKSPKSALASLVGANYPGHALLGDARALTGILLQRQLLESGERSDTGWVIFAGDETRAADRIEVSIDLGSGPKTYQFMIPSEH